MSYLPVEAVELDEQEEEHEEEDDTSGGVQVVTLKLNVIYTNKKLNLLSFVDNRTSNHTPSIPPTSPVYGNATIQYHWE